MTLVRASALSGYRELVSELGGDPSHLLRRFRIRAGFLDDPQAFVSYGSLIRLLEHSARSLRCRDFGLQLSTRQDLGILGPLGVAVRNCETLGDAMQTASRYMFVHSPAISFTPHLDGERARLVFQILLDRVGTAVQVTELSLGLAARTVALLTEEPNTLIGVRFSHPRFAPLASYRGHFGAPVEFACGESAIELDLNALALPIRDASLQIRELAGDYLELHHADPGTPLSIRVRQVVQRSLGTGSTSCVDVASAFALHPRTLQRQLRGEGTSFEKLKDETRAELARRYLANRDLPMSQVAALLDYSEQSALSRSCRRWFGQTPRRVRADTAS
ncbi:MAG: AraC family transcriptional regulator [Polyangiales bacterium]|jgi:AraC-like DNA-binding protein